MSIVKVQCVISAHLRISRCHQIKKRCHTWLLLVKVFTELKKVFSLKQRNPPWGALNWWGGWQVESWVTQLILRLQDLWQSVSQSVQSLSHVQFFATPWTAVCQASLSITNSQSLLKLMSIEWVMPSNHLIFCHPLLFLPSIFPRIRVFSNEAVLHNRCPKYCGFSFSSPSNEYSGLISIRMD